MITIDEKPTLTVNESMQLAWQHYQQGSRENARLISLRVLQVARKNPDALHLLGVLAYETNNQAMAIKLMTEALRSAKRYAPLHGNLALAKLAAGDLAGAAASARKAFELSPSYADAHRVLGIVHRHKGQLKEAVQEFERARSLGLDTPQLETMLRETREQLAAP
jgi:Tfp pilus assembly protein PilF